MSPVGKRTRPARIAEPLLVTSANPGSTDPAEWTSCPSHHRFPVILAHTNLWTLFSSPCRYWCSTQLHQLTATTPRHPGYATNKRTRQPRAIGQWKHPTNLPLNCQCLDGLTTDVLVGWDFLLDHDAIIKVRENVVILNNEPVPCNNSNNPGLGGIRSISESELPALNLFRITLKPGVEPVKQRYYPRNPAMQQIMDQEIDRMLREEVIEPSRSPWSSPVVLVRKPTGKYRFCIDFRQVNELTVKDAYPIPFIQGILDKLRGARYISTLDRAWPWSIPVQSNAFWITLGSCYISASSGRGDRPRDGF